MKTKTNIYKIDGKQNKISINILCPCVQTFSNTQHHLIYSITYTCTLTQSNQQLQLIHREKILYYLAYVYIPDDLTLFYKC